MEFCDKSFKDSALSSVAEQIPIYAVVDSITANCKVDKVQFSINGESDVTFRETMKLNQSTRKTCLIWRKKIHEKTAHVLACLGFMLVLVLLRIAGVPLGTPFSDPKYENEAQQGRKVWIAGTIETYEKKSSNNGYVLRGEGSKGKIYLLAKRGDLPVGAAVRVYGTVKKPESPRNPGMFDEKHIMREKAVRST